MKTRKAIITEPRKFEIIEEELPELKDDEFLVKMKACGLCHSDLPGYLGTGGYGRNPKYGYERAGMPKYPLRTGHEAMGEVVAVGRNVTKFHVGDLVGGCGSGVMCTYQNIKESAAYIVLPKDMKGKKPEYCQAEPLECVVNIVKQASCQFGDRIAVVGSGFMGLMTIAGLRFSGAKQLVAVDFIDERLEMAKKYGATDVINPSKVDLEDTAYEMTDGHFFDVVVEITGSIKGLDSAVAIAKRAHTNDDMWHGQFQGRAKVLIPSVYAKEEVFPSRLGFNLMYVSPVIITAQPYFAYSGFFDMQEGVEAYVDGRLPLDEMITHEIPFEEVATGYSWLEHAPEGYIKGVVTFD